MCGQIFIGMEDTYVYDTIADYELKLIRDALQRGQVTGGDRFQQEISKKLGIRLSNQGPGRPKKVKNSFSPFLPI